MARSRVGGTRGWLRGKVASDLYQVGRDSAGKKIQLVRAVEESRINNNTVAQAMARMQMALCMGSLATYKDIVDHSWEGIPYGQPSIGHFVALNVPLIQADCIEHWEQDYLFDYPTKGVAVSRAGAFKIAEGTLSVPGCLQISSYGYYGSNLRLSLVTGKSVVTMGDIKQLLGLNANDYITHIAFAQGAFEYQSKLVYSRYYLSPNIPDSTVLTSANKDSFFYLEGNVAAAIQIVNGGQTINFLVEASANRPLECFPMECLVISRYDGRKWCRNCAQLAPTLTFEDYAADWRSPQTVFNSWFPEYDPNVDPDYPL